ncbi:MAG: MBL fold metallo-hydrolase [bacterium]
MKITFCGANREVTGSCYYIETANAKIVLDCGMFQGGKFAEDKNEHPFPFDPTKVDAMVLTHAHFDHTGRIPKLYKEGFRGKIWCTSPTGELSMITLRDSVHLMGEEAERHEKEPLYTVEDVEPLENLWSDVPYDKEQEVAPGVVVRFTDAGHILGSASIKVMADGEQVAFSGDLGNTPAPLLRGTESVDAADVVIIESTYGNRIHEPKSHRYEILRDTILDTVKNKGTLLIPAFALERTQELLYELNHLHLSKQIPHIPIFLDSPMAIAATDVFRQHLDYYNTEAKAMIDKGEELFRFPGLMFTRTSTDSKEILTVPGPKVIIAGSGMMNGGRIMHHLKNYLGRQNTIVLITGYQVEGSLGRHLHEGEKRVHIYGQEIDVKADVRSCGAFSGHADYPRLMHWLNGFTHHHPKKVFVTHGELNSALSFSQSVEDQLNIASGVPEYAECVEISTLEFTTHASGILTPNPSLT